MNMLEQISSQVKNLVLDNCKSSKIEGLDDFPNLSYLSIVNAGITSLEGFPQLKELKKACRLPARISKPHIRRCGLALNLSDNRISDGFQHIKCPKLEQLKLSNNRIETFETLEQLKNLKSLTILDLYNCPVSELDDYRDKMFKMFPSLKVLDGINLDGEEVDSSSDEEDDDEENEYEVDSADEDEGVGLEYLKRDDLGDDEDDPTFEENGVGESEDTEGDDGSCVEESFEDGPHKRSHSDAFPSENGVGEIPEKD